MAFNEIENLSEEEINEFYSDLIDIGDDTRLAGCCCANDAFTFGFVTVALCRSWCRRQSSLCSSWSFNHNYMFDNYYGGHCAFSC